MKHRRLVSWIVPPRALFLAPLLAFQCPAPPHRDRPSPRSDGEAVPAESRSVAPAAGDLLDATAVDPIGRLGWLAGCWEARSGNRVTTEMWMPPAGNLMIGGSRTTAGGVVREFEHLRLRENDGAVIYTAIPSGQSETDFTATIVSDTLLVFENLQHDFPQRIAYRKRGADSIMARVEGMRADRTTRGFNIPLRRSSCILPLEP